MQEKNQKYSFVAYGRLGNVQGCLTKDEYVSDSSDMYKGKDDRVTEGIAGIIKDTDITDKSICMSSGQRA
jgi:hypothetical protein